MLFTETPVWHTFGAINISMCHSKKNFNNSRSSKERKKWLLLQMAQSLFQGVHRSTSAVECSATTGFVLAFYAPVSVMLASWKKAATRPEIFTHTQMQKHISLWLLTYRVWKDMRTGSQDRSWGVEVGDRTQTSHDERNREKDGWEVGSCAFIITSRFEFKSDYFVYFSKAWAEKSC